MSTSVKIAKDQYDEDNAPLTEDGEDYPYIMVGDDSLIFAEGFGDLVAVLFDDEDYEEASVESKLELRHDLAVAIATQAQGGVVSYLTDEGTLSPESLSEPEINLIFNSKDEPFGIDGEWSAKDTTGTAIPVILVSTHYAPFTDFDQVVGEGVKYLDPTDEEAFIRSLSDIGVVELYEVA